MKMCNLIARAAALFATTPDHLGADTLTAAEETVEVFEPMQPLHWTEDQARDMHPCAWSAQAPDLGRSGDRSGVSPPPRVETPDPDVVTAGENPPTGCAGSDRPIVDELIDQAMSRHPAGKLRIGEYGDRPTSELLNDAASLFDRGALRKPMRLMDFAAELRDRAAQFEVLDD